ncbi:MAG: Obg family GTPase CgtA [Thermoleophilaceae bacterium]|nr:Obg family GTPase CgtA [Thermoleophilaceae bacterium]
MIATSSATGLGIDDLRSAIVRHVPREPAEAIPDGSSRRPAAATGGAAPALAEHRVYRPGGDDGFRVERTGPGAFRVVGGPVERLIARHDLDNQEALRHVEERLRALGVVRELEANGFEPGDDVEVGGVVFELEPGAPFR